MSLVLRWGGLRLTQRVLSQPNSKTHFILPIFFQKLLWPPAVKGGKTGPREVAVWSWTRQPGWAESGLELRSGRKTLDTHLLGCSGVPLAMTQLVCQLMKVCLHLCLCWANST